MQVRDLMTPDPLTLKVDEAIDVAHMFMYFAHIRHLPVTDDGRVVGLVTSRDLLGSSVKESREVPVAEVMREDVIVIDSEERIDRAIEIMIDHKYGCLPVVEKGQLIGILTEADFLKFTLRHVRQNGL